LASAAPAVALDAGGQSFVGKKGSRFQAHCRIPLRPQPVVLNERQAGVAIEGVVRHNGIEVTGAWIAPTRLVFVANRIDVARWQRVWHASVTTAHATPPMPAS
jgi:hypothetical protein